MDYFVHESSYVDEPCEIGAGTKIWHFSHVMKNCRIGKNCNLGQNVSIASDVEVEAERRPAFEIFLRQGGV